ncbi:MAG TPA: hypothetical protein VNB24_00615 [Acidimicrobiales bacterium]|nr:hypothetical protein [Acidimicrobiales bacterium]
MTEDHRDTLPAELDAGYVGPYTFPDPARRRGVGVVWLIVAAAAGGALAARGTDGVLVNGALVPLAIGCALIGVYHLVAGYRLNVREGQALVAASREVGFSIGHASAQLGFRGLRSRPTWRLLLYSAENPPTRRGLVLVDAVNGDVLDKLVEDNPEDPTIWAES